MKKAIITGISGQDGYFLTKLLLSKGYEVHGIMRQKSNNNIGTLIYLTEVEKRKIIIHKGEISDSGFVIKVIHKVQPDEVYHLAAQSFVGMSFENSSYTFNVNIQGTLNVVNAIKDFSPLSKFYFAASSEMFGKIQEEKQTEKTRFYPRSPYAISKVAGYWTVVNYRESYNLFMSNGILYNHESEMRGETFVTRKITKAAAKISKNKQDILELGNINVKRDWGYTKDYIYGMWLMLQHSAPDDFILATGKTHSIKEFVEKAFEYVNISLQWEGEGINEKAINKKTGEVCIKINPDFFRPAEVNVVCGDATKAKTILKWKPKVCFDDIVEIMVNYDLKQIETK